VRTAGVDLSSRGKFPTGVLGPDGDFVLHHQVWIFMRLRQGYVHLQWYYDLGETVASVIIAVLVCYFGTYEIS
jgi:hypothetical protein